ncbi:MAG: hypothetical protein N2484_18635 [Clostridia bacterium]|nr:hypothetical protein [Clostridia bacterium]
MAEINLSVSYSLAVFLVVLISGCIVNLLKQHFIFQLTGVAFFFVFGMIKTFQLLNDHAEVTIKELYFTILPLMSGLSACLISMIAGFWLFPSIRKMFKG